MTFDTLLTRRQKAAQLGISETALVRFEKDGLIEREPMPLGRTGKPLRKALYRESATLKLEAQQ